MRLVSIDKPESEHPNEETSFEIEEEDALTQGGFFKMTLGSRIGCLDHQSDESVRSILKTLESELEKSPQLFAQK